MSESPIESLYIRQWHTGVAGRNSADRDDLWTQALIAGSTLDPGLLPLK
jgi:hypothetical protein